MSLQGAEIAGGGVIVDALLGTGFDGEPGGPWRDAIDAINAPAPRAQRRRAERRGRIERRRARARGPGVDDGQLPRRQAGALDRSRQGAGRRGAGRGHRDTARCSRRCLGGSDRAVGPRAASPPRCRSTKFSSGAGAHRGRIDGADRAPAMAGRAAARAGAGYVILLVPSAAAAAVAAAGSAELMGRGLARPGRRAHSPRASGGAGRRRAGGRGRARPRARPQRRRGRSSRARLPRRLRFRSCSTRTG